MYLSNPRDSQKSPTVHQVANIGFELNFCTDKF